MAKILSGAGGACCQFCTASFKQIHDPDIVKDGFPINRSITDGLEASNKYIRRYRDRLARQFSIEENL